MADRPDGTVPRRKVWRHERLITEHAFDKLRIVSVYEPDPAQWDDEYRRRR